MKTSTYIFLIGTTIFSSNASIAAVPGDKNGSFTLGVNIGNQPNNPTLTISGTLHNLHSGSNTSLPYNDQNAGGTIPSTDLGTLKFTGTDLEQAATCTTTFTSINASGGLGSTFRLLKKDANGVLSASDFINYTLKAFGSTTKINADGSAGFTSLGQNGVGIYNGKVLTAYSPVDTNNKYNCEIDITALKVNASTIINKQGIYEDTVNYTVTVQ